ncbi:MAG: YihY/virulence factor BrkB family protein [Acidobacteriaceae bacterium]|nr:YihY/virulence factor BrkB family protein [Acidobacteriaceae bacterium]
MWFRQIRDTILRTVDDINNNHTLAMAAGLSFYFVMSLFPMLIFAAAVLAFLPIPNLFEQIVNVMGRIIPPEGMGLVRGIIGDVITPRRGGLLSFGLLGALWTMSGGWAAMIEALNVAYDVPETRSFWYTRPLAIGMAMVIGAIFLVAFGVMLVGPEFGRWLAGHTTLGPGFGDAWPVLRWIIAIAFTVLGVEIVYFMAPNVKQDFKHTLPGAIIAVGAWLGMSYLLGIYFQRFANFNKTYGTLGAAVALMVWLYWSAFAILVGAEINSELMQVTGDGKLPIKHPPPHKVFPTEPPKEAAA